MINKLYLKPEERFLIRDLHVIMGTKMPALYKAFNQAGIKAYRSFGHSLVIKASEMWKMCKTKAFKRYYKKFLAKEALGFYEKSDRKSYKYYEDTYPTKKLLEEYFWNENDLQNLGLPGLSRDEISMGLHTGFIPSIRYKNEYYVQPWFSRHWEANYDPDYQEYLL